MTKSKITHIDVETICKKGISFQRLIANEGISRSQKDSMIAPYMSVTSFRDFLIISENIRQMCYEYVN